SKIWIITIPIILPVINAIKKIFKISFFVILWLNVNIIKLNISLLNSFLIQDVINTMSIKYCFGFDDIVESISPFKID
ncbi:MAG TPA: hypothetical protein VFT71_04025, partial [Candidatus Nitrosocosmicus sp.]|nr:hypothetical protein [Candidatus Nitrosocosmicus sp.]